MRITVFSLVTFAVLIAACGGGGKKPATKTDQASGPAPTAVEIKVPGTEPVVLVLNAALAGDVIELARLTGYTQIACAEGAGSAFGPGCREGESAGTEVGAMGLLECTGGSWLRSNAVPDAFRAALPAASTLYAMYVPKPNAASFDGNFGVQYVLVMESGTRPDGSPNGAALHIRDGRVMMLQTPCDTLAQLVNPDVVKSFVVSPKP